MVTKCHEFLGCKEQRCVMFKKGEYRNCWEVPPEQSLCLARTAGNIKAEHKKYFCQNCLYYAHKNENR